MSPLIIVLIALALLFGFLNGMHDSRNVVSTMISSRAYSPRIALGVTALAEFSGPFVFGVAVAIVIAPEERSDRIQANVLRARDIGNSRDALQQ